LQREELNVTSERAVLVSVALPEHTWDPRESLAELRALAETAGALIVGEVSQSRSRPDGTTYLGRGKVDQLAGLAAQLKATLIIFDNDLSPHQVREVEEVVHCKVIDRSELILDIFANRATTDAAQLQVEIAQLEYTFPRLRAMWDHLEQVVGGS